MLVPVHSGNLVSQLCSSLMWQWTTFYLCIFITVGIYIVSIYKSALSSSTCLVQVPRAIVWEFPWVVMRVSGMFYQIVPSGFPEWLNGLVYFSYLWLPEFCSVSDLGASISLPPSLYLPVFTRWLRLIPDDGTTLPLSPRPPEITWITCWSLFFRNTLKAAISWSSPVWEKSTWWTHLALFRTAQPTCSWTQLMCLVVWDTPVILLLVPGWSHPVVFTWGAWHSERSSEISKVTHYMGGTIHVWYSYQRCITWIQLWGNTRQTPNEGHPTIWLACTLENVNGNLCTSLSILL